MKKILALLFITIAVFSLIACTNDKKKTSSSSSLANSTTTSSSVINKETGSTTVASSNSKTSSTQYNSIINSSGTSSSYSSIDPNEGLQEEKNYWISEINAIFIKYDLSRYSPNQKAELNKLLTTETGYINSLPNHEEVRAYSTDNFKAKLGKVAELSDITANDLFLAELCNIGYDAVLNKNGNNQNKAIELFNPLGENIDLSNYSIKIYKNGETTIADDNYIINLSGILESETSFVIVNQYSSEDLKAKADLICPVFISAKNTITLCKGENIIDIYGAIGTYFSSNEGYSVGDYSVALDMHNLVRKPGIVATSEFITEQWEVFSNYDFSSLGKHTFDTDGKDYQTALDKMVENFTGNFTGDFANMICYYQSDSDFNYDFDFSCCSYYFNADGTKKNSLEEDNFPLYIGITIKDKEGNSLAPIVYTENTFYRTAEYAYYEPLNDIVEAWYAESVSGDLNSILEEKDSLLDYDFAYSYDLRYYDTTGKLLVTPDKDSEIILGVHILDDEGNIMLTSFEITLLFS